MKPGAALLDQLNQFVSKEGRLSRRAYVQCFVIPFTVLVALTWLAFAVFPVLLGGPEVTVLLLPWLAFLSVADALNIKRYHDLGNSARIYKLLRPLVVLLPIIALVVQFVLPAHMAALGDVSALIQMMGHDMNPSLGIMPSAVIFLVLAGILYNTAYLASLPGQRGPNDYGPDPLSGAQLPGFTPAAPSEENDPVKRALAAYQAQSSRAAPPPPSTPRPSGQAGAASFGRKRR